MSMRAVRIKLMPKNVVRDKAVGQNNLSRAGMERGGRKSPTCTSDCVHWSKLLFVRLLRIREINGKTAEVFVNAHKSQAHWWCHLHPSICRSTLPKLNYGVHTISPAISVVVGPTDGSLPIPLQHAHE